ncbi:hypothetical protein GGI25_002556 [Coemansia spiralis]|uniref:Uncharacterized protein n=2 Tax=Coemansia TaxID=4863 RepID=A0A9W8G3K8_9FUNG|nr:hypothetical protein BX070DRAFT_230876 [Coemansia spiralis]KAJ1993000.1 hypothetical protein EDC05_002441 [Coemansia umbellata]KAJ2622880.1 hypothetical protein GGI26_002846 [Coemansia sp. RSA 1358]KAJ2678205.1 hypothetical protein GGI25_002556 [Coemansia spiralis]
MGFKNPKKLKNLKSPLDDDTVERDLDPTHELSGGHKPPKRKATTDTPKSFQHVMRFMEMKQQRDAKKPKATAKETGNLNIMNGESMIEFNRRVKQKMHNDLKLVDSSKGPSKKPNSNSSNDSDVVVSKRTERKKRNDLIRKQRKLAKKHKDEVEQTVSGPRFGEQAEAPPVFRALPRETFKKMVPLPNSKEEAAATKQKEDLAVKKMIQRTARLSPLERMQAKRKARLEGDTAAEKRIMEAERDKAIRRYRMLKAVRESR